MRSTVLAAILLAALSLPSAAPAQQAADSLKPKKPTRLFRDTLPFTIKLTADFKLTFKDRDTTKVEWVPAVLEWSGTDSAGSIPVEITTRGHFRLKPGTCGFPGLKIRFNKEKRQNTLWEGQSTIKLGTHCRSGNARYNQIPIQEVLTYRIYNMITDSSFRVRQVKATYVDTGDNNKTVEAPAFFLEDDDDLAARMGMKAMEMQGASFSDLAPELAARMSVFLYMIGNTDWSLPYLHNIRLFDKMGVMLAVPYDFDWSGLVDAPYAMPDARLNIRSVRDRLWRGPCLPTDVIQAALQPYREKKDALYQLYTGAQGLDPKLLKSSTEYFDEFYKTINDPKEVEREMRKVCSR